MSKAETQGNVLARQAAASGRVQYTQQPPNLIPETKTGSIYMQTKKKKRGREWQKAALSKTFQSPPPTKTATEESDGEKQEPGFRMTKGGEAGVAVVHSLSCDMSMGF